MKVYPKTQYTITRALTRLRETGTSITKSSPGRPMKKRTVKAIRKMKMKTLLKHNPCVSLKKGSAKKTLRLNTYKKQKVPKYVRKHNQQQRATKRVCKNLQKIVSAMAMLF